VLAAFGCHGNAASLRPPYGSYARSVTAIGQIVLVSLKSGSQGAAEDVVRPAIRGFVDTIPEVQSVVEGHSSSPEGLEAPTT